MPDLDELDLSDPRLHAEQDLGELWRGLRRSDPVAWHRPIGPHPGFWVVTRFAEATEVYLDGGRFSSARGNVLATLLQGGDSASGVMAAVSDGARHRDLRSVLLKAFAPRVLIGVVQAVQENCAALVEAALERETCDFATEVAGQLPITVICDLLGVPAGDREFLLGLTKTALSSDTAEQSPFEIWQARNDILSYFGKLAEERKRSPGADAVSVLVTGQVDGRPLSMDEVVANCYSLILGGDETSRLSMIGAVLAFLAHPDQWAALKSGAVTVESAADEVLRWTTPAIHFGRTATADTELHGVRIAKGDIVTVWNASANRDETRFPDPDRFDLGRTPNKHLSFGHGPHYCVGAYLGKAEITAMLTALRERVGGFEAAGDALPIYSNMLSGYRSLPVRLTR